MIFASLFKPKPNPAQPLYEAIVAAARQPRAYRDASIPDTIDGRFDFLALHLSLVLERLGTAAPEFKQALIDHFCIDMDDNLRELGAGDLSVAKKVRRMAEALAGRYSAYEKSIDQTAMEEAVRRNIYAGEAAPGAATIAAFALNARETLKGQTVAELSAGRVHFR